MEREKEQLVLLADKIRKADAVVIGGGSGLSSASGYNHYHWTAAMEKLLGGFKDRYGFTSPFAGFYYCYSSYEQQWGYYSQYIRCMQEAPIGSPYLDLMKITRDKPSFILTTNVDMQFRRVFQEQQVCEFQGSFDYFQCSQPCHDRIYPNRNEIRKMSECLEDFSIPAELVPRCPKCGRVMVPWVRDDTFLEGAVWKESVRRYQEFLKEHLSDEKNRNVLLLELGVGEMTPGIIKLPFWEMTAKNRNVFYVCLNKEKANAPEHLREKSVYIAGNLADTLHELRSLLSERG